MRSSPDDAVRAPKEQMTSKESTAQHALPAAPASPSRPPLSADELQERRLLRRLQLMMNLVIQTIAQDGSLTLDQASQMAADARTAALAMFPGKELAFDLIWRPRLQRIMRERFRAIV